jgi:hypothetical protein
VPVRTTRDPMVREITHPTMVEIPPRFLYPPLMNKPSDTQPAHQWTAALATDVQRVAGYDAWLAKDIAAGVADLDAGKITPLADVRKEFGLE